VLSFHAKSRSEISRSKGYTEIWKEYRGAYRRNIEGIQPAEQGREAKEYTESMALCRNPPEGTATSCCNSIYSGEESIGRMKRGSRRSHELPGLGANSGVERRKPHNDPHNLPKPRYSYFTRRSPFRPVIFSLSFNFFSSLYSTLHQKTLSSASYLIV
jgi:hypothetical protein